MIIIDRTQRQVNVILFPGNRFNSPGSVPVLNITVDHELNSLLNLTWIILKGDTNAQCIVLRPLQLHQR